MNDVEWLWQQRGGGRVLEQKARWFPLVLQFLRTGTTCAPKNHKGCVAVSHEAWYYSLKEACRAAHTRSNQPVVMGTGCKRKFIHDALQCILEDIVYYACHWTSTQQVFAACDGCVHVDEIIPC